MFKKEISKKTTFLMIIIIILIIIAVPTAYFIGAYYYSGDCISRNSQMLGKCPPATVCKSNVNDDGQTNRFAIPEVLPPTGHCEPEF
jgi:hypothetical protein